jgi:hypothetical protein
MAVSRAALSPSSDSGVQSRQTLCIHIGATRVAVMRKTMAAFAAAFALSSAGVLQAQTSTDTRWSAWLGCWRTAEADGPTTCVVPTARSTAVDVVRIINGEIGSRQRIEADSQPHAIDRAGCRGTETTHWSPTGHRVYRRDDLVCPGGVNGVATTLMAISPAGEWLNIEGVRAGAGSLERLDRLHDVAIPSSLPKEMRTAIERRELAITTARAAASAPITDADVLEANSYVEPDVVRSWLAVSGASAVVAGVAAQQGPAQPVIQQPMPGAPTATNCTPAGCYAPNAYSDYNGYSMYPYGYSSFYGAYPWGYGFVSPLIIVHGARRPPVLVGHQPPRHEPQRIEPLRPMRPEPPRHEPPHAAPPMRARP